MTRIYYHDDIIEIYDIIIVAQGSTWIAFSESISESDSSQMWIFHFAALNAADIISILVGFWNGPIRSEVSFRSVIGQWNTRDFDIVAAL